MTFQEAVLSSHQVDSGNCTRVIRLGNKHPCPLSRPPALPPGLERTALSVLHIVWCIQRPPVQVLQKQLGLCVASVRGVSALQESLQSLKVNCRFPCSASVKLAVKHEGVKQTPGTVWGPYLQYPICLTMPTVLLYICTYLFLSKH